MTTYAIGQWTYLHLDHEHVASVASGPWRGLPITDKDVGLAGILTGSGEHFDPARTAIARIPMYRDIINHVTRLCQQARDGRVWTYAMECEALGAVPV